MAKKILKFCLLFVLTSITYLVLIKTVFAPSKVNIGLMIIAGFSVGVVSALSDWLGKKILTRLKTRHK